MLRVGTPVIASCPSHHVFNEEGVISGYVNKKIYRTGHGEYIVQFGSGRNLACDADNVAKRHVAKKEERR